MLKRIIVSCLLLFVASIGFAQISSGNPFKKVRFLNGPTDTVTLIATYTGVIDSLTNNSQSIINTINKHGGKAVKNVSYTIYLKLPGYQRSLPIACADAGILNTLKSNMGSNSQISIKCVVYHFYFIDGICNFFYIHKVNQVKSI